MRTLTLLASLALTLPQPAGTEMRPDFSTVDTPAKAKRRVAKGELVPILMFPAELGGPDDPHNHSYTTPAAAEARALLIGTLQRMTGDGLIDKMEVVPDYKGTSIIPSRIAFKAWHSRKKGSFDPTIEVW